MKLVPLQSGRLARPVWPRPLLVVGDLHANGPGRHNNFHKGLFRELLTAFPPGRWAILDLGDHFDVWETPRLERILDYNEDLDAQTAEYEKILCVGNHDDPPLCLPDELDWDVRERLISLSTDGAWTLFAFHGHQRDPACSGRSSWVGRTASFLWSVLERVRLGQALRRPKEWVVRLAHRRVKTAARRSDKNDVYVREAMDRARYSDTVLSLNGHTHCAELREIPGRNGYFYGNPGPFCGPDGGSCIVIDGRDITLMEVRYA